VEPTIVATQGSMITNIKHRANQPTLSTMEYNVEKLAATDYTCMIVMEFQKGQNFMYCSLLCCGDELYKLVHNIAHHSFSKCYCSSIVSVRCCAQYTKESTRCTDLWSIFCPQSLYRISCSLVARRTNTLLTTFVVTVL